MLKITLGTYVTPLDSDELSLVMISPYPFMNNSEEGGNYIYNFKLPATEGLRKAFRYAHRAGTPGGTVRIPFKIDANGIHYQGDAELTQAGSDTFEVMCPIGNGSFNMRSKEVMLRSIDFGTFNGAAFPPLISRMGGNGLYLVKEANSPFELTAQLRFPAHVMNTGELNDFGDVYTANATKEIRFSYYIYGNIQASQLVLQLKKNGSTVKEWTAHAQENTLSHTLSLVQGDQLTFFVKAIADDEGYGSNYYFVNVQLFPHSRISIGPREEISSMQDGATLRYPDINYAVFPVENPALFSNWPEDNFQLDNISIKKLYSEYFTLINYWEGGVFPSTVTMEVDDEEFEAGNLFVPFPYIAFIVQQIANYFNYRIENNLFADRYTYAVLLNFFIENTFLSDDATEMVPNDVFDMNNHVPDWTIYDFLQHLCNLFGVGYEIDDQAQLIRFASLNDILHDKGYIDINQLVVGEAEVDWSHNPKAYCYKFNYPESDSLSGEIKELSGLNYKGNKAALHLLPTSGNKINDCWYVIHEMCYYAWQYSPEEYRMMWVFHSRRHKTSICSMRDGREISTDLAPAVTVRNTHRSGEDVVGRWVPASHQPGNFQGAPDAYQSKWEPLVVWYHGLQQDSAGNSYPYGSAKATDRDGNLMEVPFSLQLEGARNLFDYQWSDFLHWRLNTKPVRIRIIPDRNFLRAFRWSKKLRYGGQTFIPIELRGQLSRKQGEPWELIACPV